MFNACTFIVIKNSFEIPLRSKKLVKCDETFKMIEYYKWKPKTFQYKTRLYQTISGINKSVRHPYSKVYQGHKQKSILN